MPRPAAVHVVPVALARAAALAVALAVVLAPVGAKAQVYKWVDKNGKVHYSDQKPPDAKADAMAIDSKPADPDADAKVLAELKAQNEGLDAANAERADAEAARKRAEEQKRQKCAAAQADLRLLESVNRYFTVDASGQRVYDSDAQLAARRAAARARVAESCG